MNTHSDYSTDAVTLGTEKSGAETVLRVIRYTHRRKGCTLYRLHVSRATQGRTATALLGGDYYTADARERDYQRTFTHECRLLARRGGVQ